MGLKERNQISRNVEQFLPINCDVTLNLVEIVREVERARGEIISRLDLSTAFCYDKEDSIRVEVVDKENNFVQCLEKECPFYLPPREEASDS